MTDRQSGPPLSANVKSESMWRKQTTPDDQLWEKLMDLAIRRERMEDVTYQHRATEPSERGKAPLGSQGFV